MLAAHRYISDVCATRRRWSLQLSGEYTLDTEAVVAFQRSGWSVSSLPAMRLCTSYHGPIGIRTLKKEVDHRPGFRRQKNATRIQQPRRTIEIGRHNLMSGQHIHQSSWPRGRPR